MTSLPFLSSRPGERDLESIRLMGLDFHAVDESECVEQIDQSIAERRGGWVITANLDHLRRFVFDQTYEDLCRRADLVVADGRPILWAAALQGTRLPGLVAGSNLILALSERAAANGRSVYFLGGDPGTAVATAMELHSLLPTLRITGACCPEFGFDSDLERIDSIVSHLRSGQPDIVYVGLGSPKQEMLIHRIRHHLPNAWWIGVGKSFSFICGETKRAPAWMQRFGLEWLHRLNQEPRRLFGRYVFHGLPFAARLFVHAAAQRVRVGARWPFSRAA